MTRPSVTKDDDPIVLIYSTAPDDQTANHIAAALLMSGAIAKAQYWSGVTELEMWGGEPQSSDEVAMLLVTRAALADRAIAEAVALHPYETPTFVTIDAGGGHRPFLDWVRARLKDDAARG